MRRFTSAPKPSSRLLAIHIGQGFRLRGARCVAHAVKARQVGRSLGGGDNVVNRNGVLGVRQRDLDDLAAGPAQPINVALDCLRESPVEAFAEIFLRECQCAGL